MLNVDNLTLYVILYSIGITGVYSALLWLAFYRSKREIKRREAYLGELVSVITDLKEIIIPKEDEKKC